MPTVVNMLMILGSTILVSAAVIVAATIKQLAQRIPELDL